jgi:hypothetical protein
MRQTRLRMRHKSRSEVFQLSPLVVPRGVKQQEKGCRELSLQGQNLLTSFTLDLHDTRRTEQV